MSFLVIDDSPDDGVGTDVAMGAIVFTSTGSKWAFRTSRPIDIIRWGIIATVDINVGARLTVVADFRPKIGEDTGLINGEASGGMGVIDLGTSAVPAHTTGDVAEGTGVYTNLVSSAGITLQSGASLQTKTEVPFQLDPGEEIIFAVDDAADTTGNGYMFVHFVPRGFHDRSLDATKTPLAGGTVVSSSNPNRASHMAPVKNIA